MRQNEYPREQYNGYVIVTKPETIEVHDEIEQNKLGWNIGKFRCSFDEVDDAKLWINLQVIKQILSSRKGRRKQF